MNFRLPEYIIEAVDIVVTVEGITRNQFYVDAVMAALGKKAATLEETAAETLRQAEEKAARIRDLISRTSPKDEQQ